MTIKQIIFARVKLFRSHFRIFFKRVIIHNKPSSFKDRLFSAKKVDKLSNI